MKKSILFLINGYGVEQNYEESLAWYQKAADKGNKHAKTRIQRLA